MEDGPRPRLVAPESLPFNGSDERRCLSRMRPPANNTPRTTATPAMAPINPKTPTNTSAMEISSVAG